MIIMKERGPVITSVSWCRSQPPVMNNEAYNYGESIVACCALGEPQGGRIKLISQKKKKISQCGLPLIHVLYPKV